MLNNESIFRAYDIRGVFGRDFDAEFAEYLGKAFVNCFLSEREAPRIAVSYDCRNSSLELFESLVSGLKEAGAKVLDCGLGPTPQLYFAVCSEKLDAGFQVTASHNPAEYNGFKMMLGDKSIGGKDIVRLRNEVINSSAEKKQKNIHEVEKFLAKENYFSALKEKFLPLMGERKLKVVVDSFNGAGGVLGPQIFRELGHEIIDINSTPDGNFPKHSPDPSNLANLAELSQRVCKEGADFGIAFDGDADRIALVDSKGLPIYGDMLLLIFARYLLKTIKNPIIVGDVKCSDLLFGDLKKKGAKAYMAPSGHSMIKAKLKELGADLAGELSGHMFFAYDYYGFDDALYAGCKLLAIMSEHVGEIGDLYSDLPKTISTPELRVPCEADLKFALVENMKDLFPEFKTNFIDGVRICFEEGWGLIRASNTEEALVMRFEATNKQALEEYIELVQTRIESVSKG